MTESDKLLMKDGIIGIDRVRGKQAPEREKILFYVDGQ